jgi:sugar/nucleoside kinase (ribokinase family)
MVALVAFGIILDDLVFPDGRTALGILGGGGPQTAFGMRLWSPSVGLVAAVNAADVPSVQNWLSDSGIDTGGIHSSDLPTPRAWQLMESDGRRTQLWRVEDLIVKHQLGRSLDKIPPDYRIAHGFHFGIHPDEDDDLAFIQDLRSLGGFISIEPFKPADRRPTQRQLQAILSQVDIFSTNLLEGQSLAGQASPPELAGRFLDAGAPLVVIRLGPQGSLVAAVEHNRRQQSNTLLQVPAVDVQVIDPVGAGNAYCGGFLAGWVQTQDLVIAGAWGAVAASFLVEQVGVPPITAKRLAQARQRAGDLIPRIAKLPFRSDG